MMALRRIIPALALVATVAVPAAAQVAPFDDLASQTPVPAGYALATLNWLNWYAIDASTYGENTAGCIVSPVNCGYNGFGNEAQITASSGTFDLTSAYLMGWYNGQSGGFGGAISLEVDGYLGATQLYSQVLNLDPATAQLYTFDYDNVDRVDFITNGNAGGDWYLADNVTFNRDAVSTPEPATISLFATGLVALGGIARRRRARS